MRRYQASWGRRREAATLGGQVNSVTMVIVFIRRKPLVLTTGRLHGRLCGAHLRHPSAATDRAHRPALVSATTAGLWWHRAGRDPAGSGIASPGSHGDRVRCRWIRGRDDRLRARGSGSSPWTGHASASRDDLSVAGRADDARSRTIRRDQRPLGLWRGAHYELAAHNDAGAPYGSRPDRRE